VVTIGQTPPKLIKGFFFKGPVVRVVVRVVVVVRMVTPPFRRRHNALQHAA